MRIYSPLEAEVQNELARGSLNVTDAKTQTVAHQNIDSDSNRPQDRRSRTRASMVRLLAVAAGLALVSGLLLVGCGDDDDDASAASATVVNVTEADGTITLDAASSDSGNVEFKIQNTGELTHELVVLKTDLAEDALPLNADGTAVDQSGEGVEEIGERESIAAGSDADLALDDLESGKYVLICNVPGHYGLGMHAAFTVN